MRKKIAKEHSWARMKSWTKYWMRRVVSPNTKFSPGWNQNDMGAQKWAGRPGTAKCSSDSSCKALWSVAVACQTLLWGWFNPLWFLPRCLNLNLGAAAYFTPESCNKSWGLDGQLHHQGLEPADHCKAFGWAVAHAASSVNSFHVQLLPGLPESPPVTRWAGKVWCALSLTRHLVRHVQEHFLQWMQEWDLALLHSYLFSQNL